MPNLSSVIRYIWNLDLFNIYLIKSRPNQENKIKQPDQWILQNLYKYENHSFSISWATYSEFWWCFPSESRASLHSSSSADLQRTRCLRSDLCHSIYTVQNTTTATATTTQPLNSPPSTINSNQCKRFKTTRLSLPVRRERAMKI